MRNQPYNFLRKPCQKNLLKACLCSLIVFAFFFKDIRAFADSAEPSYLQTIFQWFDSINIFKESPKSKKEVPLEEQIQTLFCHKIDNPLSQEVIEELKNADKTLDKEFLLLSDEQKANAHYQLALATLRLIDLQRQIWEENFAKGLETPRNREAVYNELTPLLPFLDMHINKALELNQHHPGIYLATGLREMLSGRIDSAKANFEISLSLSSPSSPDSTNAHLLIEICNTIINSNAN